MEIQQKAERVGRQVIICHVLRYTRFFSKLKEIIDSGSIGKVISINSSENIGNFHMAHSFVRGNWRNSDLSSPLIMQKSCHDMDILVWLTGSNAKTISSFGSLTYFKEENAPEGSSERCLNCKVAENCRFDARKQYLPIAGTWPASVITPSDSKEELLKCLETSPYGRCVYKCDNNVCDHQVSIIEFENGVTATFHLGGFTNKIHREIHIMCEDGEIYGDDETNTITVTRFASNNIDEYKKEVFYPGRIEGGHGGGDTGLMEDFLNKIQNRDSADCRSAISYSVESHLMAYAAEQSRVTGETVDMKELKRQLRAYVPAGK
jgi:predicted dehydrogenase